MGNSQDLDANKAQSSSGVLAGVSNKEFIAEINRQVRTPLTSILGFSETLLDTELTEDEMLSAVSTIVVNSQRLLSVLDSLLDFSKVEAEQEFESPQPTSFSKHFEGKVLVAEDCKDHQKLLAFYLRKFGLDITIVDNGRAAVDAALTGEFDLIIMDVQMPELDGLSATKELREKGSNLPILALTASTSEDEQQECFAAGYTGHVSKPFSTKDLIEELRKYFSETEEDQGNSPILPEGIEDEPEMIVLLLRFVDNLSTRISEIEMAFEGSNWPVLERCAHRLASAGLFGYPALSEVGRALQSAAMIESKEDSERLINEMRSIHTRILAGRKQIPRPE